MIKVRSNKDKLEIYEETNKVILKNTFIAVLLTLSGLPFIYIGCLKNDWFFCGGGILFSCLGVLFCYEVLKTYKKLKEYKGFIHVQATAKGLSIDNKKTSFIFNLYLLSWVQINKIYLVKLLISNIEYDDGATRTTNRKDKRKEKNIAIIYLNNKKGITEKSPKESQIVYFNLPESDFSLIQNNLINFSKNTIKVEIYNRVEYFYRHKGNPSKEILIP